MNSYRSLNRVLAINKAIHRHYGKSDIKLKLSDVLVLLACSYGFDTIIKIREYLRRFKRSYPLEYVSTSLSALAGCGYVERDGVKWVLSFAGRNALNDLELLVRDCRYDR